MKSAPTGAPPSVSRRQYAPRAGAGRRLIVLMLKRAAAEPPDRAALRLVNIAPAAWSDATDRSRWQRSNAGHERAAERIARRGAGLCLDLGCSVAVPGRLWCHAHEHARLLADREAAERSMRTLLAAAAAALAD